MKRERHNTYTNYAATAIRKLPFGSFEATANRKGLFDNFTAKVVIQADDMAHAERLARQWAKIFVGDYDELVVEQQNYEGELNG